MNFFLISFRYWESIKYAHALVCPSENFCPVSLSHHEKKENIDRALQIQGLASIWLLINNLVDLLDGGTVVATSAGSTAAGSTREAAGSTAGSARSTASTVELHHDGVGDTLQLLLLVLVLLTSGLLVLVEPVDDLVNLGLELLLVGSIELLVDLGVGQGVAQRVSVRLKAVLGRDTASLSLVLVLELLSLSKHALDVLLGETALVIRNDNLVGLSGALLECRDVDDSVGIYIEGDLDLGDTTRRRGDAGKLELAEQVVVLGALTLTLVDLDKHTRLVVGEGREHLGLLGGDRGVAGDELGHHATSGLNTDGEWRDIQKQDLVGRLGARVSGQNCGLNGSAVCDGLVGVDGLVGLLAVEIVGDQLLDTGDTGGTADQDDLVNLGLVDLGVGQDTVDGLQGGAEQVLAQLLETSTGDGGVEVDTLEQGVDLDGGLRGRRQSSLGTLASSAETTQSTSVGAEVLLVPRWCCLLSLELINEVVDEAVVKVLTAQVSVTGGRLDLEDTLLDGQERHIESTTTQIEDQDVALALDLLVETVGNGSRGGLVDDTQNVQASNETSVLGGLTLRIVEVGGDGDDGVVDGATKVRLGGLTHLGQDHRGDLLRGEGLGLALELNLDVGLATLLDDLEGEVLHVGLDLRVLELAANQPLRVEDGVVRVHGDLVLGGISDQALSVGKCDEGRCGPVSLVVCDTANIRRGWGLLGGTGKYSHLNAVITVHTHTRVGCAQINTNSGSHGDWLLCRKVLLCR
ncbi:hypothetical protein FJTKL_11094 [Diaporthe vaccinii]|uniref:NAD-specific glutamate dehydrogenase n=1 Tax=Diaporthe vaccinii TaxID=105482 RepID=A0ABR4EHS6_9PEZI